MGLTVEVPDLAQVDAIIEPDWGARGDSHRPDPMAGVISLGRPISQQITVDLAGDDAALRAFLTDEGSAWCFHVVHLGVTFKPDDGSRIGQAWLTVRLARADGVPEPPPIAWSLMPPRSERPVERTRSLTIGANLGFDASLEFATRGRRNVVFVETYGLQQPTCGWEFNRTPLDEIRGTQRLALIARIPKDTVTTGIVELDASVIRRRLGILPYRTALAGVPLSFALPDLNL